MRLALRSSCSGLAGPPSLGDGRLSFGVASPEQIREALRRYVSADRDRVLRLDDAQPDEVEAIRRGRAEFDRGEFVRLEDLQRELGFSSQ